ncbi:TrmH family RNA methyltransferase [Haloglycomyces albus]|uniref:TrmH family RNA methyltransferase n=1 Tax=Haloglycomyces albus TaxID=526067 RepID=UPI00046CEC9C|nr:TrmH family RNA methyltransferase [Haloglycomyces albus]
MNAKPKHITSLHNEQVKNVVALKKRRARRRTGLTVVEAKAELRAAFAAGVRPRTVFYSPDLVNDDEVSEFAAAAGEAGSTLVSVSSEVFAKMAYRESPDGWLATAPLPERYLDDLSVGSDPLVLVVEGVEKPGNLGAILRTADGVGADAVIATDAVVDWGNPNVVRASKGMVFSVPHASAGLAETLTWLAEGDIRLIAATPDSARFYGEVDYSGGVAVAVGAEHAGLTSSLVEAASERIVIPMIGYADSLNVSTSLAVIAYHAQWQRGGFHKR